jgi:hypothetical protein
VTLSVSESTFQRLQGVPVDHCFLSIFAVFSCIIDLHLFSRVGSQYSVLSNDVYSSESSEVLISLAYVLSSVTPCRYVDASPALFSTTLTNILCTFK